MKLVTTSLRSLHPGLSLETSVGSAPNPGDPGASGQPGWRSPRRREFQSFGNANPLSLKCSSDLGFPKKITATQEPRRKSLLPSLLTAVSSVPFLRAQGGCVPVRQAGARHVREKSFQTLTVILGDFPGGLQPKLKMIHILLGNSKGKWTHCGSVVDCLPVQGVQIQPLVGEVRSHIP